MRNWIDEFMDRPTDTLPRRALFVLVVPVLLVAAALFLLLWVMAYFAALTLAGSVGLVDWIATGTNHPYGWIGDLESVWSI